MKHPLVATLAGSTALLSIAAMAQTPGQSIPLSPREQPGISSPSLENPGAVPGPAGNVGGAQGAMTADRFVTMAKSGNMFEIQSSRLALEKSKDDRIKQFAQRMTDDHTKAGEQLDRLVQGDRGSGSLEPQHAQMLQQLQGASGSEFDRLYVQMQTQSHQQTVDLFESYARNGEDAQLKQFAEQTLPTLQDHLRTIQQLQGRS